jgi:hypothetical protein
VISRGNLRRLSVALGLGAGLLFTYPAVSGGLLWDIGAGCGYVALILFVCLYIFPVRGDGLPHARLLGLSQHKTVGWCVLGAAIAHIAVVLSVEPQSARYLLPSGPVFMWCGALAVLAVVALIITGLTTRALMRRSAAAAGSAGPASSRATLHVVLASLAMLFACAHVVGSCQVLSTSFKAVVVLLLLGLPLGWYALRPRAARQRADGGSARSWVRAASHVGAVAIVGLMPSPVAKRVLLEPVARPGDIAVNFPHDSHTTVNCVACHHNYVDHTGTTACIECHRSTRNDLVRSSESTFHTFCRDCHTQLALDSEKHGPTRSCSACHQGIRSSNL